jgi:hypothetical protein
MGGERKVVWPWIMALLVGLPILYVASFGPACWISQRAKPARAVVSAMYAPLLEIALDADAAIIEERPFPMLLFRYARWGAKTGWQPYLRSDGRINWDYCP